ncbi:BT_3928 family protein [Meridianimaribacter flavus]|uniref:DoxX-like protein n=1 Tax=Meridianimaribacter flavus TaxID=571115 RepID=A0ABY2G200_9FLAO|nr:BT_3928 family protein [Meridianimaribacter flavus]TDY07687.1 DoxX-like protein [Meridianimaribacter flavus]
MKFIVNVSRLLVGALFIFSGFIKLNDPLGFSYKLQEYFSYDVLNIPFLEPYALGISIFVVIFEVVLGIFLLIGYKPKFTVWSLLAMIVFFTFLTFYAAYFDKVKDCGCFGDFLKLTPWESFTKDVILLVLILILFFGVKHIKPIFGKLGLTVASLLSFIACLWFAYHVLMHLPVFDFRAYKIGSNIQDNMTIPEGAKKPVMEWTWLFDVNGEEKEFVTNGSYPTVEGKLISYETKVIEKGYEPSILDFSIESDDEDLTTQFLEEDHLVMITSYSLESAEVDGLKKLKAVSDKAIENGYTVIGLSASGNDVKAQIKKDYDLNFDFYLCDEKVLKTIVRSNPGVLVLEKGTVLQKEHWNDIEDIELPKVERKQEVIKDDGTVYLIDGEISTKEEVEALTKDDIEAMYVLKERNEGDVLDSINAANKTNYTSFVEAVLKKE